MPVVDASVVMDWVAPEVKPQEAAGQLLDRLAAARATIVGPRLLLEEVGNALLSGVRRRRWTGAQADAAFADLRSLPVRLLDEPSDLDAAWNLSRRYDEHPLYDMIYLALAQRLEHDLVTADDKLRDRVRLPWVIAPDQWQA